ncbi:carbon-nitrogen hydrolase family protein [Sulfurimonas sp.]|uniref:carbon-nitrogen hydrolase family protein n=1 Tax=Sulfurimonas sp. TaxID=2022749 RepID=UPI0035632BAA
MENIIKNLCSLSFVTTSDYEKNLQTLLDLVKQTQTDSIILAPEVCLTGFDYENLEEACEFAATAKEAIKNISKNKTVVVTIIEKKNSNIYNIANVFKDGEIVHTQAKSKLFKLGDEHKYMAPGSEDDIKIFEIDGIKIGILICFELRFKALWQKLEGADIIMVPAWWGKLRSGNFKTLTSALAVINQCYVIASDSENKDCSGHIGITTPFGEVLKKGNNHCLSAEYNPKEIKKMRKYLDVGIG